MQIAYMIMIKLDYRFSLIETVMNYPIPFIGITVSTVILFSGLALNFIALISFCSVTIETPGSKGLASISWAETSHSITWFWLY